MIRRSEICSAVLCDALDAMGFRHQFPRVQLRCVSGAGKLVGRCKTTLWADLAHLDPKPYALELLAVDSCKADDVIIIAAAGGSMRSGICGELLSTAAQNTGCVGAIVDSAVRDVDKMHATGLAVFARGTCIYDSMHRQRVVDVDVPVESDAVQFSPGDLIIADADGIVIVPQKVESEAVQQAWEKVHAENITRDAITVAFVAVVSAVLPRHGAFGFKIR